MDLCSGCAVWRSIHPDGLGVRGGTGVDDEDAEVVRHQRRQAVRRSDPVLRRRHERRTQQRSVSSFTCVRSRRAPAGRPVTASQRRLVHPQLVTGSTGPGTHHRVTRTTEIVPVSRFFYEYDTIPNVCLVACAEKLITTRAYSPRGHRNIRKVKDRDTDPPSAYRTI